MCVPPWSIHVCKVLGIILCRYDGCGFQVSGAGRFSRAAGLLIVERVSHLSELGESDPAKKVFEQEEEDEDEEAGGRIHPHKTSQ